MGKDIRIKPSSSVIQFSGSAGTIGATIELDNLGRLVLSSSQVIFGPGDNDIYIGDGTASANLIFDKDGAIKAAPGSGVEIVIGSGDTRLNISGSSVNITSSNLTIGPFSSSFAKITSGSITGSFNASFITASTISASNVNIDTLVVENYTSSYIALQPNGAIYFNDNTLASAGLRARNSVDTGSLIPFGDNSGDAFRIVSASTNWVFIASGYDETGSLPPDTGSVYYFATGSVSASAFDNLKTKVNTVLSSSLLFAVVSSTVFAISSSFTGSKYNGIIFQSGSYSGSVSGSDPVLTTFNNIFTLTGGTNYTSSYLDLGGSITLDNLGNLVIDSVSGSVYLAKDRNDIYIGDGTSSANIVFDFNGAIKGETGKNVVLTVGSSDTTLLITGSQVNLGPFTASFAQINNGNITASVISSSTLIGNNLYVTSSISGNIVQSNTASFGLISGSRLNLNNNSGIFFTGSTSTPGASIQLDNFGDLVLSAVSGNVSIGNNTNEIYIGDGSGSASLLFDFNSKIAGTSGTTLTIGDKDSSLLLTGSSVNIQPGGGTTTFGSNIISTGNSSITGSFTGSFTGDGAGLTGINISSSNTLGSFTGSFDGTGSLRLQTGSVGLSLDVVTDFLKFTSGSTTNFVAQQVAGTTSMSFAFNTGSAIGGQGGVFDIRGTAVIMNPQGNFYSENLRLPAAPNGFASIIMNGPVSGSGTQPGVWSLVTSPSSSATGSSFNIRHNQTDVINVYTSSLVQITSPSGAILSPTASAVPIFSGSDGQFLFGTVTGQPVIFVWMAGRWRSSSLA